MKEIPIKINGNSIPCAIYGNGPLTLLIAGPAGLFRKNSNFPKEQFIDLFTIIYCDLWENRVNGDISLKQERAEPVTLDNLVDEIEQIRKELKESLKFEKVIVFGHSAAGILALEYAIKYPQYCYASIVVSCPPFWGVELQKDSQKYMRLNASEKRKTCFNKDQLISNGKDEERNFILNFFKSRSLFWKNFNIDPTKMWEEYMPDVSKVNYYFQSILSEYDIRDNKLPLQIPCLWIMGIYDYMAPYYTLVEDCKDWLKNNEVTPYIMEEVGHYSMIEKSEKFVEVIRKYLSELSLLDDTLKKDDKILSIL